MMALRTHGGKDMTEPVWNKFLTERDKKVFGGAGYGQRAGFGERPAVVVIDVNYNFTGDKPEPILESIKKWPNSCGEEAWESMRHIKRLLDAARAKGVPVIYTTASMRSDGWDRGSWSWKNSRTGEWRATHDKRETNLDGNEINSMIAPEPSDIVIEKLKPSAFHGTPMNSFMRLLKADSIIMTGTTTSGCVRASVIDAFSENYHVTLAEEGCFDRSEASHAINLCDMNAKYADVVKTDECIAYIQKLPDGLFNIPPGKPLSEQRGR
jgi:nicotinamidase-related amidase